MSEGGAPGGVSFDAAAASLGLASPLFDHLHAAAAAMQEGQPAVLDLAALAAAAQPLPLALGAFQSPGALQVGAAAENRGTAAAASLALAGKKKAPKACHGS